MRLLRRNAPRVPACLQRSASASNARFSPAENWRRLGASTTCGSGAAAALGIPSPALRAPSGMPRAKAGEVLFIEEFITAAICGYYRSEEHTSEFQSLRHLVCRLLLEKKKK